MTRALFPRRDQLPAIFAAAASHPMVDDFSLRAARLQARSQPVVAPTYPLPMREHPLWSGNNELGRRAAFAPDANNRQMILKLGAWGPPKFWTVALGIEYDVNLFNPDDTAFLVVALITFGSGGTTHLVEVDWKQGSAITLPMNAVNVTAQYSLGSSEATVGIAPTDLSLAVNVCEGAVTSAFPTRTYFVESPDADNNVIVPVPPFAREVTLLAGSNPASFAFFSNITDQVLFASGPSIATLRTVGSMQRSEFRSYVNLAEEIVGAPAWVPVPDGARFMVIQGMAGTSGFTIQYRIGL